MEPVPRKLKSQPEDERTMTDVPPPMAAAEMHALGGNLPVRRLGFLRNGPGQWRPDGREHVAENMGATRLDLTMDDFFVLGRLA